MKKLLLVVFAALALMIMPAQADVTSQWVSGNLVFYDYTGNEIFTVDGTNRRLSLPSGSNLYSLATTMTLRGVTYTMPSADGSASQYLQTNGSGTLSWAAGTSGSLDDAYNSGATVTVDAGAVTLTNNAANNNGVLAIGKSPTGAQSGDLVTITAGANASGAALIFANSGSGNDITGSGSTWSVTKGGVATFSSLSGLTSGVTIGGGTTSLNASSNYATNINTGTSTGAVTIGGGSGTVAVNSSSWDISTAGAVSGISTLGMSGDLTNSGGDLILSNGKALKSSTTNAETVKVQGYDVDNTTYRDVLTITNGNTVGIAVGSNNETVAINSSDWDINATGDMTGIGAITADGLLTGSLGATISGATINLNASSNFAVNIGTGTSTGQIDLGSGASAQTLNVGTGAGAKTVTLGSTNTTSTTAINSGSGGINLNDSNNQPVNIGTGSSTGQVLIGSEAAQTVTIANGAAAKTLNLGSSNTTSTTTILSGSGGVLVNNSNNQPTTINGGTSTGTVTIGGTGVMAVDIATGGTGAKTITIGDGADTGTTAIKSGSGGLGLNVSVNQPVNIGTGTSTGTVTIGGAGAQSIDIGSGAAAKTVTLGSTNTTSATTINAGSGAIKLVGPVKVSDATELTLATDAITVTQVYHTVDTEADGASDDLATINGGAAGQIVILKPANGGRTVVVKHNVGNIQCGADVTLDNINDTITLLYDGSNWLKISSADNGS